MNSSPNGVAGSKGRERSESWPSAPLLPTPKILPTSLAVTPPQLVASPVTKGGAIRCRWRSQDFGIGGSRSYIFRYKTRNRSSDLSICLSPLPPPPPTKINGFLGIPRPVPNRMGPRAPSFPVATPQCCFIQVCYGEIFSHKFSPKILKNSSQIPQKFPVKNCIKLCISPPAMSIHLPPIQGLGSG